MSAANWVPELVEAAGGVPILCKVGKHSPYITWNDLAAADPDIIVIMPCGFGIQRILKEINLLTEHAEWATLQAVQNDRVYIADGNQFFNRPGPRVVESAEIIFNIINEHEEASENNARWIKYS